MHGNRSGLDTGFEKKANRGKLQPQPEMVEG
jgi:hypothetical protein